jgi:isoleucyl-tRNA synthetase
LPDSRAAFATLHETLVAVCRLLAPFAPFVTDWMHRELTGTSVHLAPFVDADRPPIDVGLDAAMDAVRELARLGRAAREDAGIKVRQPLSRLVCVAPNIEMRYFDQLTPLLAAELNVKAVEVATSADALVRLEAKPNFRSLGKRFGKRTPLAAKAVEALSGDQLRAFQRGEELVVSVEGEAHALIGEDLDIIPRSSSGLVVQQDGGFFAAIDPEITADLRREGLARELISRVQRMRKDTGLAVSDRIILSVGGNSDVIEAVRVHHDWIADEVLATELVVVDGGRNAQSDMTAVDLDGVDARMSLTRTH